MKNMPLVLRPIPLVALALVLAGCAPKPTIVGKWQGTVTQQGMSMNTTIEFTPDGKEAISAQTTAMGATRAITASGTYTVDGANLTQIFTTMTMGGQTRSAPATSSSPRPFTLDGDHLTLSDPTGKQSLTLTRVKG